MKNDKYIFVSYSHLNNNRVLPIIEIFKRRGYNIWYDDQTIPGDIWPRVITQHVRNAYVMLIFISKEFNESEHCLDELSFAKKCKIKCIVVWLDDAPLIPEVEINTVRFHAIKMAEFDNVDSVINKLIHCEEIKECKLLADILEKEIDYSNLHLEETNYTDERMIKKVLYMLLEL